MNTTFLLLPKLLAIALAKNNKELAEQLEKAAAAHGEKPFRAELENIERAQDLTAQFEEWCLSADDYRVISDEGTQL